jgi:WD40 repeat protein
VGGTDGGRGTLRLWDAATLEKVRTLNGHQAVVRAVAFSPDGSRLAFGSDDGAVCVWDPAAERELQLCRVNGVVTSVPFGPDGKFPLTAGRDPAGKGGEAQVSYLFKKEHVPGAINPP